MEYTIENLDKAVFYYLSNNQDTPKSINNIYNGLCQENIVPELNNRKNHDINVIKLKSLCYFLDNKFQNIHKLHSEGILHLVCTKKKDFIFNENENIDKEEIKINDYNNIVNDVVKNPNQYPYLQFNDTLSVTDNLLHLCCKFKDPKYLSNLLENYDVDIDIKNGENKKAIEIVTESNYTEHAIILKEYHYNKILNNLKSVNQKLQTEFTMQTSQAKFLREENLKKSSFLITQWCLMICAYMIADNYYETISKNYNFQMTEFIEKDHILLIFSTIMLQSFFSSNLLRVINLKHWFIICLSIGICYWNNIYMLYQKLTHDYNFYDMWIIYEKIIW